MAAAVQAPVQALGVGSGTLICKGIILEQQTGLRGYRTHQSPGKNLVIHRFHSNNSFNLSQHEMHSQ